MTKRDRNYLIVFLAVILTFIGYLFIKKSGVKAYQIIQKHSYTQDSLPKGNYSGAFEAYNINFAKVKFVLRNGKIDSFEIPKVIHAPWIDVRTSVIDSIQSKNTLEFDAVTGASSSSLYIKAAIHKAIEKSKKDTLSE
jgi:uncharacterized protein with FMN-binding domain